MSRAPSPEVPPPDLPGYRFIEHIGVGGNAQVYLYEQDLPRRKVAVKVLSESALSETARRRFRAEANVTADLAHRHIVQVFEANVTSDGRPYLVMPYYPQPNLSVRARRTHFSVAEVLRIGIQIGSAVETSHRREVLHRDIKPQNILTDAYGEPALTDFGIAGTTGDEGPEGLSVPWSPPEILYGTESGDHRSDVYSLGATLWHLLVGRSPFEEPGGDNSTYALMRRIKSAPVPRTQRADVPDSLERLLRQAMAKDLVARPQSAMELIHGLQSIEQELRLPLTQPILPASAPPAGEPPDGDTRGRPPRPSGETTFSRGSSSLDSGPPSPPAGAVRGKSGSRADPLAPSGAPPWEAAPHAHSGQPLQAADPSTYSVPAPWGADPLTHSGQPSWGADPRTQSGQAPWDVSPGTAPGAAQPAGRPWGPVADADEQETRARGPVRLDPRGPAAGVDEQETRARGPVRLSPWATSPDAAPRSRQFPPEAPEAATVGRHSGGLQGAGPRGSGQAPFGTVTSPGAGPAAGAYGYPGAPASGRAVTAQRSVSRRTFALIGGGAALAATAAVAVVLMLGHGAGTPAATPTAGGQATQAGGAQNALGAGATVPGQPVIKARRVSASSTKVLFSWTYDLHESGDTFRWSGEGGVTVGRHGVVHKPQLLLTVLPSQMACIQVEVLRAEGGQISMPTTSCWPR